jgi:hypothetical protein
VHRSRGPDRGATGALLAVALAGVAPGIVRAHDPGSGPALQVVAEPRELVLGRDAGADLRIGATDDVEDVSISTSAGRIEDVRRLPAGGFGARFVPPATRVPQVAIVAAVARTPRGTVDGWVAIPCSGQADARVRAAPGAEISLTIGGRRFGPRTAGSDGVAVIPIVVPPGVREAHHGFKPIDLGVPETPLLHAVLDRTNVLADRAERVHVLAWVVAPHGAARRGDAPVFEPSRGTVAVTERQPGEIDAVWTLPPGRAGEERIVVRLAGSTVSRSVLRLDAAVGPPAVVAVSFDRVAAVAGAEEGVAVAARALDAAGNPAPAALAIQADGASVSDVRQPEPGVLHAVLHAPASLHGRSAAVVRASVPDAGVTSTRALPLVPGTPARARLAGAPGGIRSGTDAVLTLAVEDAGGNPVSPAPVVTSATGKIVAVAGAGVGSWRVRFAAPAVQAPVLGRVEASVGSARAVLEPVLLPPRPVASVSASGGIARDLRGGWGATAGAALEYGARASWAVPAGLELAWRAEVDTAGVGSGLGLAILGGGSASRVLGPSVVVRASASGGAWLAGGAAAPAARLGVEAGLVRRGIAPFVEAAILGATGGADGAFTAATVTVGLRLGLEGR